MTESIEKIACHARTHARLTDNRRYLRLRCFDAKCEDVVFAKENGLIAIHVFDLKTPTGASHIRLETEFEPQVRRK